MVLIPPVIVTSPLPAKLAYDSISGSWQALQGPLSSFSSSPALQRGTASTLLLKMQWGFSKMQYSCQHASLATCRGSPSLLYQPSHHGVGDTNLTQQKSSHVPAAWQLQNEQPYPFSGVLCWPFCLEPRPLEAVCLMHIHFHPLKAFLSN